MSFDDVLREARQAVNEVLGGRGDLVKVTFEGPEIVIYTRDMASFAQSDEIINALARKLKKRVIVRPDPSITLPEEDAKSEIERIVPDDAGITGYYFEKETGQVTIEAKAPGKVIGKKGALLNDIKRRTGWAPQVIRTPPIPSKTIEDIRKYLRMVGAERRVFLERLGKRLNRDTIEKGEYWVRFTALGGYREVGRSATLLMTKNSKILIDVGVDVSTDPDKRTPFLEAPELQPLDSIDGIVLTHAHLDHSGLIPALYKYGYEGPVYCTPPTRDLAALLQLDYIKVAHGDNGKSPYSSGDIRNAVKHCIALKYKETTDIAPDIKVTFHNAGHILGSASVHFNIGNGAHNLMITGDIKYEKTWLFNAANVKYPRLDTVIMESTYGGYNNTQPTRKEATEDLKEIVTRTLAKKGKVLIPVFAVGRSQEVMLVLEELMRKEEIPKLPVYLDGMIWEATAIHTAYPEYLNSDLRRKIFADEGNPFLSDIFNRVETGAQREAIIGDPDPKIVLATSGMMNGGPVMEYFKHWADDENNTLIFVGYQAEGTLGNKIQRGWKDVTLMERGNPITIDIKMDIESSEGFSGHSDRRQLMRYVSALDPQPKRISMCHGEESKSIELAYAIKRKYGIDTIIPKNLETVRLK